MRSGALIAVIVLGSCSYPQERPRFPHLRTQVLLLDAAPSVGTPLRIRLDLINDGDRAILYDAQQCDVNASFEVLGPDGRPVRFIDGPRSTFGTFQELGPHSSVTLIKETDLTRQYLISKPGRHTIRFQSYVRVVDAVRHAELEKAVADGVTTDYFGRLATLESWEGRSSNVVTVEIRPGTVPEESAIAEKLLVALPEGWDFAVNWVPPRTTDSEYTIFSPGRKKGDPLIVFRLSQGPPLPRETKAGDVGGKSLYIDSSLEIEKLWPDHRQRLVEILNGR